MVTGLVSSLLPSVLLAASLTATPTPPAPNASPVLAPLQVSTLSASMLESTFYVVNPGDSLASIALSQYGSEDYWTSVWNDNPWIQDPSTIETGWQIKIRVTRPTLIEELKPELQDRINPPQTITEDLIPLEQTTDVASEVIASSPAPSAPVQPIASGPLSEAQIDFLGNCESGMTASRNSGNGYYGAFQFSPGTWNSMGTGYERADIAPLDVQKDAVQRLVSRSSVFTQFPGCSAKMRAAGIL